MTRPENHASVRPATRPAPASVPAGAGPAGRSASVRPYRDSNAELALPLPHGLRDKAVEADGGQQETNGADEPQEPREQPLLTNAAIDYCGEPPIGGWGPGRIDGSPRPSGSGGRRCQLRAPDRTSTKALVTSINRVGADRGRHRVGCPRLQNMLYC
jgi:hypothetical protein